MKLQGQTSNLLVFTGAVQAFFYIATGIWPLMSMSTFLLVTGSESKPESSLWLVKTVGVLVAVIGAALALAVIRRCFTPEIVLLAVGSALGLVAIDVIYVTKGPHRFHLSGRCRR
jgi:hypothetical protein